MRVSTAAKRGQIARSCWLGRHHVGGFRSLAQCIDIKRRHLAASLQKQHQAIRVYKAENGKSTEIPEPTARFVKNVTNLELVPFALHLTIINWPIH